MVNKIKRRYKPLYKKFLNLRSNVQNNKKIINFKKKKWSLFLFFLKKRLRFAKKPYSHLHYKVSKFASRGNSFQKKFKSDLTEKKKFNYFYGGILKKYLKKRMLYVVNSTQTRDFKRLGLELFESRLDSVLYRAHFACSFRTARQFINHGYVMVNKRVVTSKSYVLNTGDLIEIKSDYWKLFQKNVIFSDFWPIPPKYLVINYKTMQIIFGDIKNFDFSTYFPFRLNISSVIMNYYRH